MSKKNLVYCIHPSQYEIFDERINKPLWFRQLNNGLETGSMVIQEMDEICFPKNPFEFFAPNNVALLLSVSKKYADSARNLYKTKIDPKIVNHSLQDTKIEKKIFLQQNSILAADYIEQMQIAIVFSFTAIEAFINLSIPEDYKYEIHVKNKGITEIYNKEAIERWVSLTDKISSILTVIYKTKKVESEKFWSNFKMLEKMRNNIIHQKSIDRTDLYKDYFQEQIFRVIESSTLLLQFFYEAHAKDNQTNPLWPWAIGKERAFAVIDSTDPKDFEIVGNIHQGQINKSTAKKAK